jgi:hypothetical protein
MIDKRLIDAYCARDDVRFDKEVADVMNDVRRLYLSLQSAHNHHGGCGCNVCKGVEMALFDVRNRHGFKDGLIRDKQSPELDGRRCPKCQSLMTHTRLAGYRCPRGCQ